MKRRLLIPLFFLVLTLPVTAQYIPPPGAGGVLDLTSPLFLGGAGNGVAFEPPLSDALNPATSATRQRTTLDLNYAGLPGLGDDEGFGHSINAGVTIPTKAGVFSGSGSFVSSSFDNVDLGTYAGLNLSFSKDLFPTFLVGAGLGFLYGSQDQTDWGLGLDLGFLHLPGDVGPFKDFRWGGALRDLGKGFSPVDSRDPYPAPFTPALGAAGYLIRNDTIGLALASDLSFPTVQDLRVAVGTELSFKDTFFFRTRYLFDYLEYTDSDRPSPSFPLAFGATIKLAADIKENVEFLGISERGWNRSEVRINLSATPLPGDVWAFGLGVNIPLGVTDRRPPDIDTGALPDRYISPNLDGTEDALLVPLEIEDERFVKGYRFVVTDENGEPVRTIQNKENRPENLTFSNIIDRLLYVKTGIIVPSQLRWDGRNDDAELVADGVYLYSVEAWDDNGNIASTEPRRVVVDNTPPEAEVEAPYLIFSPNADGNKDALILQQTGTEEDAWVGEIANADGQVVRTFRWEQNDPPVFEWDGTNDQGILVPDGVYTYRVATTDRAGNDGSARLTNIIINTEATPIDVLVDRAFFSPNGDDVKDDIRLILEVPVQQGLQSWALRILDAEGNPVRTFEGPGPVPQSLVYDGRDSAGQTLAEGNYTAQLEVLYENGNNPGAVSPAFTVDLTEPRVAVRADLEVFSPNGDGSRDEVVIYQETSEEVGWAGLLRDQQGRPVLSLFWRGRADSSFTWDGRDDRGQLVPDGTYTYTLQTSDRAGNDAVSQPQTITLDTEEKPVLIAADLDAFSPNGDGEQDSVLISPQLRTAEGVESFTLQIVDDQGDAVRTVQRAGVAPRAFGWDGRTDEGLPAPEGSYRAEIAVRYINGDTSEARSNTFAIDRTYPEAELQADVLLFSPNGDGRRDVVTIRQTSSSEALWEGEIINADGEVVRSLFWKGRLDTLSWNGTDDNGNPVPDGQYTYVVRAEDPAGNETVREIRGIAIDTRPTPVFATAVLDGFSPNGDGFRDEQRFNLYVNLTQGIERWELALIADDGTVPKTFRGEGPVPSTVPWNGAGAPDGTYRARLTVEYEKGNLPESTTAPFRVDRTAPELTLTATPKPFSPDNDGVDDELTLRIGVEDISPIDQWLLEIRDPVGNTFVTFSGEGRPTRRILWDGRSQGGELVQAAEDYTAELTVLDTLGNRSSTEEEIPVDVLVIREGDRLKIAISSITFAPDTADYLAVEPEKAEKNLRTLARLAEIFEKYRSYNVRIEGHAVNLSWENPARAAVEETQELLPLSKARAEAVRDALVELGMDEDRISTEGLGGRFPVVPHGDLENRWKNRRVEFILVRQR